MVGYKILIFVLYEKYISIEKTVYESINNMKGCDILIVVWTQAENKSDWDQRKICRYLVITTQHSYEQACSGSSFTTNTQNNYNRRTWWCKISDHNYPSNDLAEIYKTFQTTIKIMKKKFFIYDGQSNATGVKHDMIKHSEM